jgi:hypothetical protein
MFLAGAVVVSTSELGENAENIFLATILIGIMVRYEASEFKIIVSRLHCAGAFLFA